MKTALDATGCAIAANSDAPRQARCPHCGGIVILRGRRRSQRPADVTWFWRHQDNAQPRCLARLQAAAPG